MRMEYDTEVATPEPEHELYLQLRAWPVMLKVFDAAMTSSDDKTLILLQLNLNPARHSDSSEEKSRIYREVLCNIAIMDTCILTITRKQKTQWRWCAATFVGEDTRDDELLNFIVLDHTDCGPERPILYTLSKIIEHLLQIIIATDPTTALEQLDI